MIKVSRSSVCKLVIIAHKSGRLVAWISMCYVWQSQKVLHWLPSHVITDRVADARSAHCHQTPRDNPAIKMASSSGKLPQSVVLSGGEMMNKRKSIVVISKCLGKDYHVNTGSVLNQFTSGILYFFQSPVRDYFQWKFGKKFLAINKKKIVNETKSGQPNKHLFSLKFR